MCTKRPASTVQTELRADESSFGKSADACLNEDQVLAFVQGHLDWRRIVRVDEHLGVCPACSLLVAHALPHSEAQHDAGSYLGRHILAFEPGSCIASRFMVVRCLGRGGMGEVYEAFDTDRRCSVALKTARATDCDSTDASRRLCSELELARRVNHPNVCRAYELGVHHDARPRGGAITFLSMELVEGEPLARCLERGALPSERLQDLARQLLTGMSAIHAAGVIHRDIKSHNVLLCRNAQSAIAIIDFGLAIDSAVGSQRALAVCKSSGGALLEGSPAFMAPEQFDNAILTPAADVFACGVVLFHGLTGMLPFRSLVYAPRRSAYRDPRETPLRALALLPSVSARFDAFLSRCLELDPQKRYATGGAALDALNRALA